MCTADTLCRVTGSYFGFSANWQMIVNTVTTVATFLMVFVIQNSQNRDDLALQIKVDEIIRAVGKAQNSFIDLEDRSQEELNGIKADFATIAVKARNEKGGRGSATLSRKIYKASRNQTPNHKLN